MEFLNILQESVWWFVWIAIVVVFYNFYKYLLNVENTPILNRPQIFFSKWMLWIKVFLILWIITWLVFWFKYFPVTCIVVILIWWWKVFFAKKSYEKEVDRLLNIYVMEKKRHTAMSDLELSIYTIQSYLNHNKYTSMSDVELSAYTQLQSYLNKMSFNVDADNALNYLKRKIISIKEFDSHIKNAIFFVITDYYPSIFEITLSENDKSFKERLDLKKYIDKRYNKLNLLEV